MEHFHAGMKTRLFTWGGSCRYEREIVGAGQEAVRAGMSFTTKNTSGIQVVLVLNSRIFSFWAIATARRHVGL